MKRHAAFFLSLILVALGSRAQEPVTIDSMQHPGLLLKTSQPGAYIEAPTVSTEISLDVSGVVARGVVRQRFENPTDRCVEAIYVFPLADNATVDAMRLKIGVRTIEGQIKEREEAARVYEEAKSEGRNASLLEQQRPNLFTVSVASIAAGEIAEIEIEYQQIVTYEDGKFSVRVPLAIGPRYGGNTNLTLPTRPNPVEREVHIDVDLDAGIALSTVTSSTHPVQPVRLSGTRMQVKTTIAPDRDFVLAWTPQLGALPQSAEFSEVAGDERYTLLMLFPPDVKLRANAILPRETIFIIDTSGSMGGPSIEQAKKALLAALRRVRSSDRFNVIEFNSDARRLFETSRRADRDAVDEALRWVESLESTGGTEMLSALQLALPIDGSGNPNPDAIRQVIFMTDGQVGNESEVFAHIRENLGGSRLFTIGIGNAPNTYFMSNAARAGRGTFTQIGDLGEVEEKMTAIFRKLESPVLSDISMQLDGQTKVVPDLYAGEPLVVTLKSKATSRTGGRIVAEGWNGTFSTSGDSARGVAKLWARQEIDRVRDGVFTGAKLEDVRREIVTLALAHHLVTEHTSLVAVDTTPAAVDAKSCTSELIPINLPAAWGGIEGGFEGALPQTATNATLFLLIGCMLLAVAWKLRA